ncbi:MULTISPECIES: hypothetical protein [Streptosporangium]|uniref:Uncharacterized protein n=1 Tax=Streptosporangium brasiliense TaxID=47480 RepID=A0ABT9RIK4_9ACTN|nr:hypothetical protein [Streptosporangium brasiliense]MDP9869124.1 hypothetical protein [Streptosporangium brasiliense]
MTWWKVLRERPTELARVCALTPHSRAEQVIAAYGRHRKSNSYVDPRRTWATPASGTTAMRWAARRRAEDLAEALHACRATVVISGYGSPLYDEGCTAAGTIGGAAAQPLRLVHGEDDAAARGPWP